MSASAATAEAGWFNLEAGREERQREGGHGGPEAGLRDEDCEDPATDHGHGHGHRPSLWAPAAVVLLSVAGAVAHLSSVVRIIYDAHRSAAAKLFTPSTDRSMFIIQPYSS